jgi:hypothetical protein
MQDAGILNLQSLIFNLQSILEEEYDPERKSNSGT